MGNRYEGNRFGAGILVKVLITDGNERAALAVTRALGGEQVEVIVGAESQRSLAGSSRYCRQSIAYPSP